MIHQIDGLPVHPLVIHAAVVLVPLAAILAVLFIIPRTRHWSALPLPIVAVLALASVYVAKLSGENLKATLEAEQGKAAFDDSPVGRLVQEHEGRGNTLLYIMIAFAVLAIIVYGLYRSQRSFTGITRNLSCLLLLVGAVVIVVQVVRVGDIGARAVWNPTGTVNYGSPPLTVSPGVGSRP